MGDASSASARSRRSSPRVSVNRRFARLGAQAGVSHLITDVSRTGAFICTERPMEPGTEIRLRLRVVHDGIDTICGRGRVVRVSSQPSGMGVRFTALTRDSKALIARLVETHDDDAPSSPATVLRFVHPDV